MSIGLSRLREENKLCVKWYPWKKEHGQRVFSLVHYVPERLITPLHVQRRLKGKKQQTIAADQDK